MMSHEKKRNIKEVARRIKTMKNILASMGSKEAEKYAKEWGLEDYFNDLIDSRIP